MITKEEYDQALPIVLAYHAKVLRDAQLSKALESVSLAKQKYRDLEEVETGDTVRCDYVHSASTEHLTKGKEYEVLNTNIWQPGEGKFLIKTDSGKKKWYYISNNHFKLLN